MDELIKERDHLAGENDKNQQLIKSLHQELAGDEAELDDDDDCYTASDVNVKDA